MATADPTKTNPPAEDKAAAKTANYEVLTPLEKDGKRYEPGEMVKLNAADAKPLLDVKCVKPAG